MRPLVVASIVALASGCWPGGNADELREGVRSLVPRGSRVVANVEGDCVELARSPSCIHIYFIADALPLNDRVTAVEDAAEAGGWSATKKEFLPGGANLRFRRRDIEAVVYIWREERALRCREAPARECADAIFVERR
jgi:hypothetical protein